MSSSSSAHMWLFPLVMAAGFGASGYQFLTGKVLGWTWIRNPTYIRVTGAFGMVISGGLLVYWIAAIGPGAG